MSAGTVPPMAARPLRIAPSILTADLGRLAEQIAAAEAGGADLIHLDVMDGHFVPQLSFGPLVVEAVRRATRLPIEVHMMVANPAGQLAPLAEAGAQTLIFHLEATNAAADEPQRLLERARALGCSAGVALNPGTPAAAIEPLLALGTLDEVIVMTVHPGHGGQSMLVEQLDKVTALRRRINALGLDVALEVDGGVKTGNIARCAAAGAQIVVAGSAVYNERETPAQALAVLRRAALAG